jgi:hypothetical protein
MNQPEFSNVLRQLAHWRQEVIGHLRQFPEDATALTKKLELDTAIRCLEFCEKNRIMPTLRALPLPAPENTHGEFRLMWDYETEDRTRWQELQVGGDPVRAIPGDLLLCQ